MATPTLKATSIATTFSDALPCLQQSGNPLPETLLMSTEKNAEPRLVNIYGMGRATKKSLVEAALQTEDQDHEEFLKKLKTRMDEYAVCHRAAFVHLANLYILQRRS